MIPRNRKWVPGAHATRRTSYLFDKSELYAVYIDDDPLHRQHYVRVIAFRDRGGKRHKQIDLYFELDRFQIEPTHPYARNAGFKIMGVELYAECALVKGVSHYDYDYCPVCGGDGVVEQVRLEKDGEVTADDSCRGE